MTGFHSTPEWFALTRKMKPVIQASIDAGEAVCVDCGRPVLPGQKWDTGHRLAHKTHSHLSLEPWNLGPSHIKCNRSAGARLGNTIRAQRKARCNTFISWKKN